MIKDVAVDCDKLQSHMSRKQKIDCTAGQWAFYDTQQHPPAVVHCELPHVKAASSRSEKYRHNCS